MKLSKIILRDLGEIQRVSLRLQAAFIICMGAEVLYAPCILPGTLVKWTFGTSAVKEELSSFHQVILRFVSSQVIHFLFSIAESAVEAKEHENQQSGREGCRVGRYLTGN